MPKAFSWKAETILTLHSQHLTASLLHFTQFVFKYKHFYSVTHLYWHQDTICNGIKTHYVMVLGFYVTLAISSSQALVNLVSLAVYYVLKSLLVMQMVVRALEQSKFNFSTLPSFQSFSELLIILFPTDTTQIHPALSGSAMRKLLVQDLKVLTALYRSNITRYIISLSLCWKLSMILVT